jgi:tripeptidyl-peptidase-1
MVSFTGAFTKSPPPIRTQPHLHMHLAASRVHLEADVQIEFHSEGWTKGKRAASDALFSMVFAVKQQNGQRLTDTLVKVSDPRNKEYGQHLRKDEVDALVAPTAASTGAVRSFLEAHGITSCETTTDMIRCKMSVATAEEMLNVEMFSYTHSKMPNTTVVRAANHYSLPQQVARHVDFVAPVNRFPPIQQKLAIETKKPLRTNTPASLRALYNVGDVEGKAPANKLACTAFLKQYYHPADLAKFYKKFYPAAVGRTPKLVGPDTGFPGIEASLDIEYISTMGGGVEAEFWSFHGSAPDNPQNEPFLDFMYLVSNTTDAEVPKIFSTSYGEGEKTVSMAYMNRIELEFQKASTRGVTFLFASGDSGVASDSGDCPGGRFTGQWPAGSPWVTAVGGTEDGNPGVPESAWSGSSGGFSDRWPVADFQKDAVAMYLKTANLPASSHFNASSRGFPDVSAQSTSFTVINGGMEQDVAGTSCACPTFSGVLGLLNDLRLQAGKSTLGWVNPFFYQNPTMFNDIVSGNNGAGGNCGEKGFEAIKGWDAVTGLGTPNYAAMSKVVTDLP